MFCSLLSAQCWVASNTVASLIIIRKQLFAIRTLFCSVCCCCCCCCGCAGWSLLISISIIITFWPPLAPSSSSSVTAKGPIIRQERKGNLGCTNWKPPFPIYLLPLNDWPLPPPPPPPPLTTTTTNTAAKTKTTPHTHRLIVHRQLATMINEKDGCDDDEGEGEEENDVEVSVLIGCLCCCCCRHP